MDITGLLPQYGPLTFREVQWWGQGRNPFRLFLYSINGVPASMGLRMDMDKKALMDDPQECPEVAAAIRADVDLIWKVAVELMDRRRLERVARAICAASCPDHATCKNVGEECWDWAASLPEARAAIAAIDQHQ